MPSNLSSIQKLSVIMAAQNHYLKLNHQLLSELQDTQKKKETSASEAMVTPMMVPQPVPVGNGLGLQQLQMAASQAAMLAPVGQPMVM